MTIKLNDPGLLKTQAYINGQWQDADSGVTVAVVNPCTGETVAEVASCGKNEARQAIAAAKAAFNSWRQTTAKERSQLLRRWFDLIIENQEDLAQIMTAEQGKSIHEARGEIGYGASFIEWFAEEARRLYGDIIPTTADDRRLMAIKQPVGVVGAITPWNFPNAMITRKAGPALGAGCTFVARPATETPLSALALAELADRAGFPAGVINILSGTRDIGTELTTHPEVAKVTFTGSTPVGKMLLKQSADTVKKVSMELGGNAPVVIFNDADIDQAVAGAAGSKYRNAGQTCICANRILVQADIYDQFVEKLAKVANNYKLGNGADESVNIGPMINAKAVDDAEAFVRDAVVKGARVVAGGRRGDGECFFQPTILTGITQDMRVASEEIFGPIAPIFKFETEEQALAMANDTEFGLASYVYTRDLGRAWRFSEALEYGMVGVNEVAITSDVIPFGGVKQSGMGREGSKYGMDDYTEIKYICMGGI